jgi:hypothetical protein
LPLPPSYCKECEKYGIKTEAVTKEHERRPDGGGSSETIWVCGYHWIELFKKQGYNIPMPTKEQIAEMEKTSDFHLDDFKRHEPPKFDVNAMQNPWIEKNVFVFIDEKDYDFISQNAPPILTWSMRVALDARFINGLHQAMLQVVIGWIDPSERKAAVSIMMSRDDLADIEKALKLLGPQMPGPIVKFIRDALEAWKAESNFKKLGGY